MNRVEAAARALTLDPNLWDKLTEKDQALLFAAARLAVAAADEVDPVRVAARAVITLVGCWDPDERTSMDLHGNLDVTYADCGDCAVCALRDALEGGE